MKMAEVDLKSMPFNKRVEHIWEYYKIHIVGSLLAIFMVGSFIYGQVTRVESVFNVTFIVGGLYEDTLLNLEEELTPLLVEPKEKKLKVTTELIPISNSLQGDSMNNMQMMQKFTVRVAAGEIDAVIVDKSDIDMLVEQGILMDLSKISEIELIEELVVKGKDGNIYGLSLEQSETLKELPFNTENKVITVCGSSKKLDQVPKVMNWVLN